MKFSARFEGIKEFQRRLKKLADQGEDVVQKRVAAHTLNTHREVIRAIKDQSVGKTETRYGGSPSPRTVVVSKPGDAPNLDQGTLSRSYKFNIKKLLGEVGSDYKVAPALEFGTKTIAKRPHLGPALDKIAKKAKQDGFKLGPVKGKGK